MCQKLKSYHGYHNLPCWLHLSVPSLVLAVVGVAASCYTLAASLALSEKMEHKALMVLTVWTALTGSPPSENNKDLYFYMYNG